MASPCVYRVALRRNQLVFFFTTFDFGFYNHMYFRYESKTKGYSMNEMLLELKGIRKTFPGVKALDGVDFILRRGEVHALVGENGAGKSTLIKIVTGVHKPDEGTILLDGKAITIDSPHRSRELGIGVIYQETSLFPDFSVMGNLFAGWEPRRGIFRSVDYRKMKSDAEAIFARLQTDIDVTSEVSSLGIAQKQMVEIAKALSFKSRVLIMDEPTAALSQKEVDALFKAIAALKAEGVSIIYISHRLEEIYRIADRVTVLRDGKYVADAEVADADTDKLVSWMVGRSMDCFYPKMETTIGEPVLEVRGLTQKGLIEDASFQVRAGEILGLAGLAGSGRTELALAIVGFTAPDSGKILVDGVEARIADYCDAMDLGLVYVSEDRGKLGLVLPMSVQQNITLATLRRISRFTFIDSKAEASICREYIERFSIKTPEENFVVGKLSGGNQQKVAVSKALAAEPKVLILDEPTRGVDVGAKAEIHRIISELSAKGLAIIMISSELPEVLGMSDRILVLRRGRIIGEVMRQDATQEKVIAMALGTEIKDGKNDE